MSDSNGIEEQTVYHPNTDEVRARKEVRLAFEGSPNYWLLEIQRPDGFWKKVQRMGVRKVEDLFGLKHNELPYYEQVGDTKYEERK